MDHGLVGIDSRAAFRICSWVAWLTDEGTILRDDVHVFDPRVCGDGGKERSCHQGEAALQGKLHDVYVGEEVESNRERLGGMSGS